MPSRVLITGGAGFIGSHVADLLLREAYQVRVLDCLDAQVHGAASVPPAYLDREVELITGDVRDADAVARALENVDAVIHLAARVGVGQSMYEMASYIAANEGGTAVLLEALSRKPVARLVVASSMSIYGEGAARDGEGIEVSPPERSLAQLRRGAWDLEDETGAPLTPVPTSERKPPSLSSVYALNKYAQERLCLIAGRAYDIPTIALRFFNVFGTRQALSNPYTGVLAIFAARLLNDRPPRIFEDGNQQRDFVHVSDVAQACLCAVQSEQGIGAAFNVGSGEPRTVRSIAEDLAAVLNKGEVRPHVLGKFRAGDIRHCFADISHSRSVLGFVPKVNFRDGLAELAEWLAGQVVEDRAEHAARELERRGLVA
jgi:dTDP-L-rhamnose 4-epimerase